MTRQFNPSDSGYIEVAERIIEFRQKYPDGSLSDPEVILWPTKELPFVAVKACAFRSKNDPRPGVGLAWEPFPGKTPYTKDSELQNAETSAWGRAIVAALAADTKRGIASANEVRNRRDAPSPPSVTQAGSDTAQGPRSEPATTSTGGRDGEGPSSGGDPPVGDIHRPCGGVFLPANDRPGMLKCSKCNTYKKAPK